jgi:hypothetical protein
LLCIDICNSNRQATLTLRAAITSRFVRFTRWVIDLPAAVVIAAREAIAAQAGAGTAPSWTSTASMSATEWRSITRSPAKRSVVMPCNWI